MSDEHGLPVEPDPLPRKVTDSTDPAYADQIREARAFAEQRDREAAEEKMRTDGFGGLVPYHNKSALIGYYCAVASLLPCFPIGLVAAWLGYKGLQAVKETPAIRGTGHAYFAMAFGGFFGLLWLALLLLPIVAALFA